jgi:hypothetical protein
MISNAGETPQAVSCATMLFCMLAAGARGIGDQGASAALNRLYRHDSEWPAVLSGIAVSRLGESVKLDVRERLRIQGIYNSPKCLAAVAYDDGHRCGMNGLMLALEEVSVDILLAVFDKADVLATVLLKLDRPSQSDQIWAQSSFQLGDLGGVGRKEIRYVLWSPARALLQQLLSFAGG